MSKKDFEPHYRIFTNHKDFVKVGCTYAGKMYYGVAKCAPEDTFNFVFGYKLAKARCDFKICSLKMERSHEKLTLYKYYRDQWALIYDDECSYEQKLHKKWMEAADNLNQIESEAYSLSYKE